VLLGLDQLPPRRKVGGAGKDIQLVADDLVEHLLVQHHRDLVDRVDVPPRSPLLCDVGDSAILAALVLGSGWMVRHSRASAWMPISRSS